MGVMQEEERSSWRALAEVEERRRAVASERLAAAREDRRERENEKERLAARR